MKLRVGGIQTVINQALEKEKAKASIPTFSASSLSFSGTSYSQEIAVSWGSPIYAVRESVTQVEVSIPRSEDALMLVLNTMWAGKKGDIIIEHKNFRDSPYHFKGAFISEVCELLPDDDVICITITYDYSYF